MIRVTGDILGDVSGEISCVFKRPIDIKILFDIRLIVEEFIDDAIEYNTGDYNLNGCWCKHCGNEMSYNLKIFIHKPDCLVLIA